MTATSVTGRGLGAAHYFPLLLKFLKEGTVPVRIADLTADEFKLAPGYEVWDDLRIGPGNATLGSLRDPSFQQFRTNGAGSIGVYTYMFTNESVANNQKEIFFEAQLPHKWAEGTPIIPHVHFAPITTATGTVRWGLEYTWANVNETFPQTTIVYAERAVSSADQYGHQIPASFGEFDATDKKISSVMLGRLFRNSSHANDTLEATVAFLSVDIHYMVNTLGSEQEYIKWNT